MSLPHHIASETRLSALSIAVLLLAVVAATLGAALAFQHLGGYEPCALCLQQRNPYYATLPLALAAALAAWRRPARKLAAGFFAVIALLMAYDAALGAYHAGVEWGFWEGPAACAAGGAVPGSATSMIESLQAGNTGPSCTEAVWRFLGLSFAGWNVLIAGALALLAGLGVVRAYGSSSVSQ